MDEARRIVRLVTPGLVFAIELSVLFLILRPDRFRDFMDLFKGDKGIGVLIAGFLGSGGLGYIFSSVHHNIHAWEGSPAMNHKNVIKRLVAERILILRHDDEKPLDPANLTRSDAWIILTSLWHERTNEGTKIANMEKRTRDLVDQVHALGASRIAAVCAPAAAFLLAAKSGHLDLGTIPVLLFLLAVFIALFMFETFQIGYRRTARYAQGVIDQVLTDTLLAEKARGAPFEAGKTWPLLPEKREFEGFFYGILRRVPRKFFRGPE
jgi:hypothetical protein